MTFDTENMEKMAREYRAVLEGSGENTDRILNLIEEQAETVNFLRFNASGVKCKTLNYLYSLLYKCASLLNGATAGKPYCPAFRNLHTRETNVLRLAELQTDVFTLLDKTPLSESSSEFLILENRVAAIIAMLL